MIGKILLTAVNAVFPIVLLILLGYWLRQTGFFSENFVKTGNKLVFRICLPAMLFVNVYEINSLAGIPWDVALYCVAAIVVLFLLGMLVSVRTTREPSRRGVLWQCSFRSNFAIIGISLSVALGGASVAAISTVLMTLLVPLFNIFAIVALETFQLQESGRRHTPGTVLLEMVQNPLLISICLGLACLGVRWLQVAWLGEVKFSLSEDLTVVYSVLKNLKSVATPLALLVLGGQFQFSVVRGMFREIAVGTLFRVVAAPVLAIGGALLLSKYTNILSCGSDAFPAMLALFGSPVAVSSAVMAGEMGGDEQLATQLVVWTSIASVFTIFAFSCVLMAAGLIAI